MEGLPAPSDNNSASWRIEVAEGSRLVADLGSEIDELHAAVRVVQAHHAQAGRARPRSRPQLRDVRLGVTPGRLLDRRRRADLGPPHHPSSVTANASVAPVADVPLLPTSNSRCSKTRP